MHKETDKDTRQFELSDEQLVVETDDAALKMAVDQIDGLTDGGRGPAA